MKQGSIICGFAEREMFCLAKDDLMGVIFQREGRKTPHLACFYMQTDLFNKTTIYCELVHDNLP